MLKSVLGSLYSLSVIDVMLVRIASDGAKCTSSPNPAPATDANLSHQLTAWSSSQKSPRLHSLGPSTELTIVTGRASFRQINAAFLLHAQAVGEHRPAWCNRT